MERSNNVALVVPSIREDSFNRFVTEWEPTGLFQEVDLILMEDNPTKTFPTPLQAVAHFSWEDIDKKKWSWIVPRRSDTVRSFAYWFAWKQGYEFIMTLDDDCYPADGYRDLRTQHMDMLTGRTRWFNTLNNVIPRGMPYYNRGHRNVYVNHGIWQGVLDYDAPHQLVQPTPEVFDHSNRIVPNGAYFPLCGMNVMWRSEATVLMYHLLMGRVKEPKNVKATSNDDLKLLPFDRFGDIWCGIIMKKIADHLRWGVSTGTPYIHHDRASNPFTNLRKEANGIEVNEWFWEKVDEVNLTGLDSPVLCYTKIGVEISKWTGEHQAYWELLGNAMVKWSELFLGA